MNNIIGGYLKSNDINKNGIEYVMKRRLLLIFLVAIPVLAIALVYGYSCYAFWEPKNINRDSLAFTLKIPNVGKDFPIWSPVDTPLYSLRVADGVKPRFITITYASSISYSDFIFKLSGLEYQCKSLEPHKTVCTKTESTQETIETRISRKTTGSQAHITIIGGK